MAEQGEGDQSWGGVLWKATMRTVPAAHEVGILHARGTFPPQINALSLCLQVVLGFLWVDAFNLFHPVSSHNSISVSVLGR